MCAFFRIPYHGLLSLCKLLGLGPNPAESCEPQGRFSGLILGCWYCWGWGLLLATRRRSKTDISPSRRWRDSSESDSFPSRSLPQLLLWCRPAGVGVPGRPGGQVGNPALRSLCTCTRHGEAPTVWSPATAVGLSRGPAGKHREPNFLFEVCEARALLDSLADP